MSTSLRSIAGHRLTRGLRAVVPLLLMIGLVARLGTEPFERSLAVLAPAPILAALLIGAVTTTAQAMRWRTVAAGYGTAAGLTRTRAVSECYRSSLLNAVLPGGVMGDAVRAWRQREPKERGLRSSAQAVIGERLAGTALLLGAVSIVTLPLAPWVAGLSLVGALATTVIAIPTLRRLVVRDQFAVWGWSLLFLASLVTKFGLAAAVLGTVPSVGDVITLALIVLAGMSVPIGIAGFGPREAAAAVAFAALGLSADAGVATSAGYGMLAAVSALPGGLVMLYDLRPRRVEAVETPAEEVLVPVAEPVRVPVQIQAPVRVLRPVLTRSAVVRPAAIRSTAVQPVAARLANRNRIRLGGGVTVDLLSSEPARQSA